MSKPPNTLKWDRGKVINWKPYLLIMNIVCLGYLNVTAWLAIFNGVQFILFIGTTVFMTFLLVLFLYLSYRFHKDFIVKKGTVNNTVTNLGLCLTLILFIFTLKDNHKHMEYSKQIKSNFSEQESSFGNMKISRCDSVGEKEFSCNGTVDVDDVNKEFKFTVVNDEEHLLVSKD